MVIQPCALIEHCSEDGLYEVRMRNRCLSKKRAGSAQLVLQVTLLWMLRSCLFISTSFFCFHEMESWKD
ncbi:hypothetical protein Ancab_021455 [Ancistrocladus abbreviatus]